MSFLFEPTCPNPSGPGSSSTSSPPFSVSSYITVCLSHIRISHVPLSISIHFISIDFYSTWWYFFPLLTWQDSKLLEDCNPVLYFSIMASPSTGHIFVQIIVFSLPYPPHLFFFFLTITTNICKAVYKVFSCTLHSTSCTIRLYQLSINIWWINRAKEEGIPGEGNNTSKGTKRGMILAWTEGSVGTQPCWRGKSEHCRKFGKWRIKVTKTNRKINPALTLTWLAVRCIYF